MSFIGAIKSFLGVQEAKTEDLKKETQTRTAADTTTGKVGTMLATGQVSESEAHSGQNGQSANTGTGDTYTAAPVKNAEIDAKKMAKTYKKNPLQALSDKIIGREYNADEAAELKELIKDKDDLQNYFELAKQGTLSNKDIVAGLKELAANKTSYLWGLFKGNKLNEEKFASNMSRVRKIRKDFSSEGAAHVSKVITRNEEFTDTAVHMMSKRETYSEANVIDGVNYLEKNPKKAENFFNGMIEMENIRDEKGAIKYKGDTILKVTKARTSNPKISSVLLKAAKRTDMKDEPLTKITDDIEHTPQMAPAMEEFIEKKNAKGEYVFSSKNLCAQSAYMRDKDAQHIETYRQNTMQLASYDKMTGDAIVQCAENVTKYPKTREQVMNAAADAKIPCEQVQSLSNALTHPEEASIAPTQETNYTTQQTNAAPESTKYTEYQQTAQTFTAKVTSPINATNIASNTVSNQELLNAFGSEKEYEYVAQHVKQNPELKPVIEKLYFHPNLPANKIAGLVRQYSTQELEVYAKDPVYFEQNPQMLKLYVKNKNFFDKLNLYNIAPKQKEQLASFATGATKELLFEMLDSGVSPDKIATYLTTAKRENKENELKTLITTSTLSSTERMEKLNNKDFAKSNA